MALDELKIIVDVVDSFSEELDEAMLDLAALEGVAEAVDDITIDVDVLGEHKLDKLHAQLLGLNLQMAQMRTQGIAGAAGGVGGVGGLSDADRMADEFDPLNISMADLHNVLAQIIPLLLVYVGALPAAIAGVVALGAAAISAAAGLAAIGGLAAAGAFLQDDFSLEDLVDRIRTDFEDAFGPLMDDLSPLFYDMLDGFEAFMDAVAARGDILRGLVDDARAFGGFILDWVPDVMAEMGRMAEAWGPLLGQIASTLNDMNILRGLTQFMARAAPAFFMFADAIFTIIERIVDMSIGFMQAAAIVTKFLDGLLWVISGFGKFEEQVGIAIGALLTLYSAMLIVDGIAKILASDFFILESGLLSTAKSFLFGAGSAFTFASALRAVAIASGIGIALVALGGIIGFISNKFINASSDIDKATDSLREFKSVSDSFGGAGSDFYGVDANVRRRTASMGAGGGVTINIDGNADEEMARKQLHNGLYRAHRTQQ